MFDIRHETPARRPGQGRAPRSLLRRSALRQTCERLREGRLPADGLSLAVTRDDALVATLRLWHVTAGPGRAALMLGPVAVEPTLQGVGIGAKLIREALAHAAALGHRAVLLVGDAPYYARFGFSAEAVRALWLPGPYERERFLGLELVQGALAGARGLVQPTGALQGFPTLAELLQAAANDGEAPRSRAA
jgi:predicted N-acetyltransferase YhbS